VSKHQRVLQHLEDELAADQVRALHRLLLDRWDDCDAAGFAAAFADDGSVVGFDGSMVDGRSQIEAHLAEVFADHRPPRYVSAVRDVRRLGDGVVLLRAVAGLVPRGATAVEPSLNAVQSLVAVSGEDGWRAALFQTTPAAFHGRPDDVIALTEELQGLVRGPAA